MGQRGLVLMLLNLGFGLEVQSGIPRFCTSARAVEVPRERGIRASSISALFYSPLQRRIGHSSGVMCLELERESSVRRAEISSIQYFYSTLERESWRSSVCLVVCPLERVNLRSSGNLFFWKFRNCFLITSLHPHPILGILRPSLRHIVEDIDVEHTEAN